MSLKIPDVPSFVLTYDKGCVMPVRVPQMSTVLGLVLSSGRKCNHGEI